MSYNDIPWFKRAVEQSKEVLRAIPEPSRPTWIRENPQLLAPVPFLPAITDPTPREEQQ